MPIENPQDISRESSAKSPPPDASIRRAEDLLGRAEALVGAAIEPDEELHDAEWRLTLARWRLGRRDMPLRQWPRQAVIVTAALATVTYIVYRLFWTLNVSTVPAAAFSFVLWGAEFYAAVSLGLYLFQVWRLVEPPLRRPIPGRTVDVFVATYNEDVGLLRGTLTACLEMEYPHTTYVLDDGARDEVRQLAESLGVRYISRTDRTNAKAGNVNNALRQTDGEFVVILDADHVPYRHYITRLIGYFEDPRMGFVQAPHTTYNLDNFMGRWKSGAKAYWEDVRIFFEAVQLGKNRYGLACFCGSAAIFRRKAIEDVGLFATETITEDMHTGMRINAAGWKSIAVSEEMVVGLAPDDAATFASQRLRWGEGNLSVMAYDNPLTMPGLTLAGRINYLASIACWTMGPARLILYLTPLVMLLTGVAPVADMSVSYFAIVAAYLITVWTAVKVTSNGCGQLLGIEMAMMASFHLQLQALWRAIFGRRHQKFVVTEKRRTAKGSKSYPMWPQAALVGLSIIAVTWAASRIVFNIADDYLGLVVGGGLAVYHSWLALTVLARAGSKRDVTEQWRHPLCLAVDCSSGQAVQHAISIECNENGCQMLTWTPLRAGTELEITFHSPVGSTMCHGRVATSMPLRRHRSFGYLSNVELESKSALQRERESDSLRRLLLRYVVPVVTMAHRLVRQGSRALPEELSGEGDLPIPVSVRTDLPNIQEQKSVALSINSRGFLTALETPCPVGHAVQVALDSPLGTIAAEAEVVDVETMRVGTEVVYQHEFRWRYSSPVRPILSRRRYWRSTLTRSISKLRNRRQPPARVAALQLTACLLVGATILIYGQAHNVDRLLAEAARQSLTPSERAKVEVALSRLAAKPNVSTGRLLRIYEAAAAIGDHVGAADAAQRLADRGGKGRLEWALTSARQLAKTGNHTAADAAFDKLLAEPLEREFSLQKQAEVYVEAARAAIAANEPRKAAERFLRARDLTTTDPELTEELLGVLISAKESKLAVQILGQLEPTDRVLRRIVDVYEIAGEPEKALPQLQELHRRLPQDGDITRRLAELAVARRDFSDGLGYYRSLWKLEPNNKEVAEKVAETMLLLARDDVAAKRFGKAIALFDESFRIQPPQAAERREYGGLLAQAGRMDAAVAMLESLDDPDSRFELAGVLEMQGNRRRALQILLELEKSQAVGNKAGRSIVRLLMANGEYAAATDRLLDLFEKEPNDSLIQQELVAAIAATDHPSDAARRAVLGIYQKCRENDFQTLDMKGFEHLSDALRRLELFREADTALQKAVAKYPDSRRLRFYLADTLGRLGRFDDAETQYEMLLDARRSILR